MPIILGQKVLWPGPSGMHRLQDRRRHVSTPKHPGAPLAFHRSTQLSALPLPVGPYHPPPTHHDLSTGYDDPFVRVGIFDIVLKVKKLVLAHVAIHKLHRDNRCQDH
jgi:hypothetical protein